MDKFDEAKKAYFPETVQTDKMSEWDKADQALRQSYNTIFKSLHGAAAVEDIAEFCGESMDLFCVQKLSDLGYNRESVNLYLQGRQSVILHIRDMARERTLAEKGEQSE